MAVVYLASDLKHGRRVAIKVMAPRVAEMVGPEHFLREIEVAARLNHPHILPLFDSGLAGEQLFYVMPFIEGESLRARLAREKRLPVADALRLIRDIAEALQHAHARGLVHRDIKPENVLLSEGIPLVADFGIAYAQSAHENPDATQVVSAQGATMGNADVGASQVITSASGPVVGTPLYMAPEQALGLVHVDGRADQYALGCVLFELLAGEPPFRGRNVVELLELHMRARPPEVTTLRPDVPDDVARALARALKKDPAERFTGMSQFVEALAAVMAKVNALAFREGAGAGVPNNLPISSTSFVGRQREMVEVRELLAANRLVTLAGSGGTGKTRLSLQVAADVLVEYPDGAWLVELAPLMEPALVPKAVASALDVKETAGETLLQALVSSIAAKRMLLLLDNCEHVIDAAAQLVHHLLRSCAELRVIATSREALGLTGEVSYKVPSLPVPEADQPQTLERVMSFAAARLFVERAVSVKPDFTITEQNAPALASVCRRLDGMPLAIELAAARVRALPLEQIEARLDSRFRLLTGGSRIALPRQQTLRALIDWSYDLLKPPEQRMLSRLSVFIGGWTLEAAEKICGADGIEEWEVLDLLTSLVDKSLVVFEESDSKARYRLLETVRQYARDRLHESGLSERWRDAHLAHYCALSEEAAPNLTGKSQSEWLERLEREHENLRAALEWSEGDPSRAASNLKLAGMLQQFWLVHGHFFEGRERLARALALDPRDDAGMRARALNGAGNLAYAQADWAAAQSLHEEGLAIRRQLGDRNGIATSLNNLGGVRYYVGDIAGARGFFEESLAIRRELGEPIGVASSLNNLGLLAQKQGDRETERAYLLESLSIRRSIGDRSGVGASLHNCGVMEFLAGNWDAARAHWEESLAVRREIGDRVGVATTLQNLGRLAFDQGDPNSARTLYEQRLALSRELGDQLGIIDSLEAMADVAAHVALPEAATRLWGAALRLRTEIGSPLTEDIQAQRDPLMETQKQVLGEARFATLLAEGHAMSMEDLARQLASMDEG